MVTQVNVYEAKSQLSRLIERVLAGEQVTIAKAGRPVVDLVAHQGMNVEIGVEGWRGHHHDPNIFDGHDPGIAELFYGGSDAPA